MEEDRRKATVLRSRKSSQQGLARRTFLLVSRPDNNFHVERAVFLGRVVFGRGRIAELLADDADEFIALPNELEGAMAEGIVFWEFYGEQCVDECDKKREVVSAAQSCCLAEGGARVRDARERIHHAVAPPQEPVRVRGAQRFQLGVVRQRQGEREEFLGGEREAKPVEQQW